MPAASYISKRKAQMNNFNTGYDGEVSFQGGANSHINPL